MSSDPFHLQRFIDAQAPCIDAVYAELRAGEKHTHWMWFIFPQIAGLGKSETAVRFALQSVDEARGFARHPVLGRRLRECTEIVTNISGRSAVEIFDEIDAKKLQSSMTLFAHAMSSERSLGPAPENKLFVQALARYYDAEEDVKTLQLLH